MDTSKVFDPARIAALLQDAPPDASRLNDILTKSLEKKGLVIEEIASLIAADRKFDRDLFAAARHIRDQIYGNRIVLFAPLYFSNWCQNDCTYCAFCVSHHITRKRLDLEEVRRETRVLLDAGHKRTLLEAGEDPVRNSIDYTCDVIDAIYGVENKNGDRIRRVNVNIAATSTENYRKLATANIGTYNLFQETYHKATYENVHPTRDLKGDYERQLFAMDRAIEGGLKDLGIAVLWGLYDWKFELLALVQHAEYLERTYGVGPHTISVPRICPAPGVPFTPPYPVSDDDFLRIIAILRLAVPYTGMVISTRETPVMRMKAFEIAISQASAGSSTEPGGYSDRHGNGERGMGQFATHSEQSLDQVTAELLTHGFIPSHCTACEFMGREGKTFLPYAKSGAIKFFCQPNSLVTLSEYLRDYASAGTRQLGKDVIAKELGQLPCDHDQREALVQITGVPPIPTKLRQWTKITIERIEAGDREYRYV